MRIGIEVQRLFRKKKYGIESSSLELIKKLKEVEPHHEYVIFAKKDEDATCLEETENFRIKVVGGKLFVDFEQFFLPIAAGREHVDVLHCTGNTAPYFSPAPIVQTLHDVIFMDSIPASDTLYQRFGNHYRRLVVPLVTKRSKAIITVSEYEKQRIIHRLGLDAEKVHVVYNGINERRFHANIDLKQKRSVQMKYGLPHDFILFLGNQSLRKNPERALEAYVRYAAGTPDPIPLVTPGLPEKFVAEKLRSLDYSYTREQFITPGYIDDTDLPALYSLSRIFLFPSLSEGFGMPIIEAMACGVPVITSAMSSMPEIAGHAAILTDPFNPQEIATALYNLAANDRLRAEKTREGWLNTQRFSLEEAARKVLALYEAVFQQHKSAQKTPGFLHKHVFAARH